MGPFVNSVACLQKDHKKYPNLFCFVWLVNPEDSEKGLDIFWVWISEKSKRLDFFRHHFVYANMNRWLREGKDVNAMLPYLMRYMGHSDVKNTLYYLHLVPDIYGGILDRSRYSEKLIPEVDDDREE